MNANFSSDQPSAREGFISLGNAAIYYRDIGRGQPIVILHGGPDFDHNYLLPDLDRLADAYRLIYYDQRGRGKSALNVRPEDVSLASEIEDLEGIRAYFGLETIAILGHSWGGLLAMEYALRHPQRVSHLILMNTAPASRDDYLLFREERRKSAPGDVERLKELSSSAGYAEGDLEAYAAYYRVHFRAALRQPELLERLVGRLRFNLIPEGILKARAIEDHLMDDTWSACHYDLFPQLLQLRVPTLVLHGDYDFVPQECAAHIARAIPGARLVVLKDTGHFAYLERPDAVRKELSEFLHI